MDEEMWAKVQRLLENENDDVFAMALRVFTLKETPQKKELQALLDMTTAPSNRRNFILEQLGAMGSRINVVAPDVARRIKSGDGPTKRYHILLDKIGDGADAAVEILASDFTNVEVAIFESLGSSAKSALPELKRHFQEQEAKLRTQQLRRFNLIGVLGALDDGDPQPYIEIVKRNFDGPYRSYAVSALGKIAKKHPSAVDQLIEFLPDDSAISALVSLGPLAKKALPKLQELRQQDPESFGLMFATWTISGSPTDAIDRIRRWGKLKENEESDRNSSDRTIEFASALLVNFAGNEEVEKALEEFSNANSPRLNTIAKRIRKQMKYRD